MKDKNLIEKTLDIKPYFNSFEVVRRKAKKRKSENLIFQGGLTRKFNKFSRIRASRFNYKLFLRNQQYFRQWLRKRKTRVYQTKKLSRNLLKASSNKKVSLSYFGVKYLSLKPSIFFASQGFVKNLSESKLLVDLKQIRLEKDFDLIKKQKSLDHLVFKVASSVSEILLGSYLRRREEKAKFAYLIGIYQNLMWRFMFKGSSYGSRSKGFFEWPLVCHILGVRSSKRLPDSFFFKKLESTRGLPLKSREKGWVFKNLLEVESLKELNGLTSVFLDSLFFKELKRSEILLKEKSLESRGLTLSSWEEDKKFKLKNFNLSLFQKKELLGVRIKKGIKMSFSRNLNNLFWKKKKLKTCFEKFYLTYVSLKLRHDKLKEKKNRRYFVFYTKKKDFKISLRKKLWIKKCKKDCFLTKSSAKDRAKVRKNYNFGSRIPTSYEVNYKTLSIYYLGKFSQIGGRTFGSLPLNLGALFTRLTY